MERKYKSLPDYSDEEINRILREGTIKEVIQLPLSVGAYSSNWKKAQDICVKLSIHTDERVRANCALGLAYIARREGRLEKHIVKPVLLELLRNCEEYRWRIIDSIDDINNFMKWNIGYKAIQKN